MNEHPPGKSKNRLRPSQKVTRVIGAGLIGLSGIGAIGYKLSQDSPHKSPVELAPNEEVPAERALEQATQLLSALEAGLQASPMIDLGSTYRLHPRNAQGARADITVKSPIFISRSKGVASTNPNDNYLAAFKSDSGTEELTPVIIDTKEEYELIDQQSAQKGPGYGFSDLQRSIMVEGGRVVTVPNSDHTGVPSLEVGILMPAFPDKPLRG